MGEPSRVHQVLWVLHLPVASTSEPHTVQFRQSHVNNHHPPHTASAMQPRTETFRDLHAFKYKPSCMLQIHAKQATSGTNAHAATALHPSTSCIDEQGGQNAGFDWDPATGKLWAGVNERQLLPPDIDARPDDLLLHIPRAGLDFGFPFWLSRPLSHPTWLGLRLQIILLPFWFTVDIV